MKRTLLLLFVFVAAIAVAGNILMVKPGVYDPENTGIISAAWVTHQGSPDAGGSDHGLYLAKMGPTATNAAAVASIQGVAGIKLKELGFDYRLDGHCGAGAPRFNVSASDGFHFAGGCANGAPVGGAASGWLRVRIDPTNGAQTFPAIDPNATVKSIEIVFDEGTDSGKGFVYLDNIDVNGTLIGKPGNAK